MGYYDDEGDEKAPGKPPGRRWRLMHFTLLMLSLLFVSKATEFTTGMRELLSVREARAATEHAEEATPAPAAEEKKDEAKADEASAATAKEGEAKPEEKAAEANAEAKPEAKEATKEEAKKEEKHGEGEAAAPAEEMTRGAGKLSVKEVEALKAKQGTQTYTQSELDLLQNLTHRRNELDEREKELELKSKVLDATEKRIDNKVTEMKSLEGELSKVVAQYNTKQDSEIKSLVKIYENMKPADAAKIFNEMDMPILLEVVDKMSERKVAPVLASMDPRKARDVTQELAEMRRGRSGLNAAANAAAKPGG